MERPQPMDRLVCGDVGFGKTEVAIRAVFKAVQDGYQAAVLVPTTLLASQHVQTFADRYAPFPVRVEMLSRFLTNAQARAVLAGLADGSVDVVIGTHRLLGEDVHLQEARAAGGRRGAALRGQPQGVDQGAWPTGSTCSPSPPAPSRAPSRWRSPASATCRWSTPRRRPAARSSPTWASSTRRPPSEAIRRELLREGQVFYVHNRVQDIEAVAQRVRRHGPRGPGGGGPRPDGRGHRSRRWCSTSGRAPTTCWCARRSSSRASTCRRSTPWWWTGPTCWASASSTSCAGRVGRAGQRAYAYLFHPVDRVLSEQAYERLRTIGDHTELGSGFKIALRDLQIRGAGNLLGPRPVRPHRRHRLRPLRPDGRPRRWPS